jgi:hypothetical protein
MENGRLARLLGADVTEHDQLLLAFSTHAIF